MTSVIIPDSVTSIGANPFRGSGIQTVICLSKEFEVDEQALYTKDKKKIISNFSREAHFTIPDSVTAIGTFAFSWCENLTSVTIPRGSRAKFEQLLPKELHSILVEQIELSTEVTNEDRNNGIKDEFGAIYSPDGLRLLKGANVEKYSIRKGTKVICDNAFSGCWNLTSITIPDSVTAIGDSAFSWCKSLSSVTIPDSVTAIGDCAFSGCFSLTSVTIPDSVTAIGDNPFEGSGIRTVNCLSKKFEADEQALYTKDKKKIISYFGREAHFTIPDSVTDIGDSAFSECTNLTSVTIPDSVTAIGNSAFNWCRSLTSVTIPDSVTAIGDSAFSECTNLTSITIPNSVTAIGDSAFSLCEKLTSVTIPNSVTAIGNSAFNWCRSLTSVTIPDSVTAIGDNPFKYSGIQTVNCLSKEFEADEQALYTKDKKKIISYFGREAHFTIPGSVTAIGNSAFYWCESLTSVTIPDSVTAIGYSAFEDCRNLTSVTIPNSVTAIGNHAFYSCWSLTSVTIPDSVTAIGGGAFWWCENLTSVTIPDSVTSIGDGAFYRCENLTSITIPDSVTHIGDFAFSWCGKLTSIIIPRGSGANFKQLLPEELHSKLVEQ